MIRFAFFFLVLASGSPLFAADLGESFTAAVERNRRGGKSSYRHSMARNSRLVQQPIVSTSVIEIDGWGEQSTVSDLLGPGENGDFFRTDWLRRGDQAILVNTSVESGNRLRVIADQRISVILYAEDIGSPSRPVNERLLTPTMGTNLAVGTILSVPLEEYMGSVATPSSLGEAGSLDLLYESDYGTLTLSWLDKERPAHAYPDRLSLNQDESDLTLSGPLGEYTLGGGNGWPKGQIESLKLVIDNIVYNDSDAGRSPAGWVMRTDYQCSDGTVVTSKEDVERVGFDSTKSKPGFLAVALPVGSPVTVEGASHLKYAWDGDWAVPAAMAIKTDLGSSPGSNRFWWIIGNVFVILILAGWWYKAGRGRLE